MIKKLFQFLVYVVIGVPKSKMIVSASWDETTEKLMVVCDDVSASWYIKADGSCWSIWIDLTTKCLVSPETNRILTELYAYCTNYRGDYPVAHLNCLSKEQLKHCHLHTYKIKTTNV